jgi:hypothetical protein
MLFKELDWASEICIKRIPKKIRMEKRSDAFDMLFR